MKVRGTDTPFHEKPPHVRRGLVRAFMVWRIGTSVRWQCTVKEIAKELGVSADHVRKICKDRGWVLNNDTDRSRMWAERPDVEYMMRGHYTGHWRQDDFGATRCNGNSWN